MDPRPPSEQLLELVSAAHAASDAPADITAYLLTHGTPNLWLGLAGQLTLNV